MRTVLSVALFAAAAYVGTMFDNFFAFAAQLVVTKRERFRRVSVAQVLGVATLVTLAAAVGSLLSDVPLRWVGLLCVGPFAFAYVAWRRRHHATPRFRRGGVTTFLVTVALGGDNLAAWIPLLRSNGWAHAAISLAVFALGEVIFLSLARSVATRPRVVAWGERHATSVTPMLYVALGVLVLIECRTF